MLASLFDKHLIENTSEMLIKTKTHHAVFTACHSMRHFLFALLSSEEYVNEERRAVNHGCHMCTKNVPKLVFVVHWYTRSILLPFLIPFSPSMPLVVCILICYAFIACVCLII